MFSPRIIRLKKCNNFLFIRLKKCIFMLKQMCNTMLKRKIESVQAEWRLF